MEVGSSENGGRAALIVNTRSRSGERAFFDALDRLQDLGVSLGATYALSDPARLPETVREVLDEGLGEGSDRSYDTLILGGGDGSISSVVDFLAHHRAVLGLLPLGTANDFARTLGIPSSVTAACEAIAHGKVVDVDLGLIGDNYYVNLASVGLSVGVTQALTPRLKRTAGALAYLLAAVKAFLRHEPFSARLVFPDGDHEAVEIERLLQIGAADNVEIRLDTRITDGGGEGRLEYLLLEDSASGLAETVPAAALFVVIGATPHTDWLPREIERDEAGYVLTDRDLFPTDGPGDRATREWPLKRLPLPLETSMPGVFTAGDARHRSMKRVAPAVGEGSVSINSVREYLNSASR